MYQRYLIICVSIICCYICTGEIQKQYLERYRTQSNISWLFIPYYNDWVAIQTSQTPRLNPDGSPKNFTYVDPVTQKPLQKGYFCWRSDYEPAFVNPRYFKPNPKKQPEIYKQAYTHRKKDKATAVRTRPNAPSVPAQKTKDSQTSPANKKEMMLITQNPAPSDNEVILTTSNVYAQGPYIAESKPSDTSQFMMDPTQRNYFFLNGFYNPYLFQNADFICVQEWENETFNHQQILNTGYTYIGHNPNPQKAGHDWGVSGIFYNASHWKKVDSHLLSGHKNKVQAIATFQNQHDKQTYITIASCHLPHGNEMEKTLNNVQKAAEKQSQSHKQCPIVIAGDFNYDTYPYRKSKNEYTKLANTLKGYKDASAIKHTSPRTLAPDKCLDYIWHTNQNKLKISQFHRFPEVIKQKNDELFPVLHVKKGYYYHYSDHAALRAQFTLAGLTKKKPHVSPSHAQRLLHNLEKSLRYLRDMVQYLAHRTT